MISINNIRFVDVIVLLFYLEWHLVFLQTFSFFKEKEQFQSMLEKKDILKLSLSLGIIWIRHIDLLNVEMFVFCPLGWLK